MIANKYILFCLVGAWLGLSASPLLARTFTNRAGKKIDADLVAVKGDQVTIKMANGKVFTLDIATLSKADQEFVRSQDKSSLPVAEPDERIQPGATVKLDFPDLAPDRRDQPAALHLRVPDQYDPAKPTPLIVWLGGGDGGNSADPCAALVDSKQFLMVGLPYPKGADNPAQANMVGEFDDIWDYHKTMLDEVAKLVPNIDPRVRIIAGFSNGAHAIDGMMSEKSFREFFKAYVLIDGGTDSGRYSGMSGTFAYIAWGADSPNAGNAEKVAKSAKRGRMSVESHAMEGVGHAFPAEEKELVKKWIAEKVVPGLAASPDG